MRKGALKRIVDRVALNAEFSKLEGPLWVPAIEDGVGSWMPLGAKIDGQDETIAFIDQKECEWFCAQMEQGTPIPVEPAALKEFANRENVVVKVYEAKKVPNG
jgi:hypothetical protein